MAIVLSGSSDGNNLAGSSSQILSETRKGSGGEMVGGCSVCCDDQGTERNLLVYCDGCEVAVHQACYGIISVPSGNWFCRKCESGDSQNKIKCELCPSKDGALKKTETGAWAHVVCALYIPEIRFGNNNTMEPIEIKHIQADRYNKSCYLCEEGGNLTTASYGAVMNCHKPGCKQAFHVTCAQSAGLLCEEGGQGSEHVNYCGYCKHHFRKLKAGGSRKAGGSYLNNSNSSYADSASDSSQDNDSRCNRTEQDKSSTNRTTNKLPTLPTNLSMNDAPATNSNTSQVPSTTTTSKTSTAQNNAPISLTIPLNTTSNFSSKTSSSSSSSATTTHQKKKRAPKGAQPANSAGSAPTGNSSASSTLLATTTSLPNSSAAQPTTASSAVSTSQPGTGASQADVYKWSGNDTPVNNKSSTNPKKKQATASSGQSPALANSAKQTSTSTTAQAISMTNYNLQKIAIPNLSLSTSPSLASPSNSTKSTSTTNSSTSSTATATSSSCSSSNSPSPALLSPNISSNRGSAGGAGAAIPATRFESPLASNSKTGSYLHNRTPTTESVPSNTLPIGQQNNLQTRIGSSSKNDQKKNSGTSSSLLSTAVPHEQLAANIASVSMNTNGNQCASAADINPATTLANLANFGNSSIVSSAKDSSTSSNTQPTVPPLIIPVPTTSNSTASKSASKAKPAAKTTRKKSAESNETPKIEPKTKSASRSKKSAAATPTSTNNNNNNNNEETIVPKTDNKRAKSKNQSKSADSATVAPLEGPATKSTSSPNKRKSRSASNDSSSTPSPVKRQRKKKTAPTQSSDQQAPNSNPPPSSNHLVGPPRAASTAHGTGPLMISTPMVNNRLLQGLSSAEGHADSGNRYFSPMASPYASFEHMNATSLSRASLSRLFTSSSADSNQASCSDDPGKAFEELRDNTWSHLSKCVLEQAAQFDIPSLIGTLYTLRSENEKLVNKVRDLTMRRDQMIATNARLDLPGPMLTQHLNATSPNFSSVASGLANSPKSLPTTSPGSNLNKQPHVSVGSYNHVQPGSLGPPGSYLDRSSPLVSQTHSGINNIKSSALSTPSPPIGALMAHSTSNRAGLITVNPPYMPNVFPQMNSLAQLGASPGSYYPRQ